MKIGATTDGTTLKSKISEDFESAKNLLIIETDDNSFESFNYEESEDKDGISKAKTLIKKGCEAVITGKLSAPAFEVIAFDQVTRYEGAGMIIEDALKRMDENKLEYIRVPEGEVWTPHDHSTETCECGVE